MRRNVLEELEEKLCSIYNIEYKKGELKGFDHILEIEITIWDDYLENGKDVFTYISRVEGEDLCEHEEYKSWFIHSLSTVTYDNGYGRQELYGNVWLKDGTWLARFEYDGAESWEQIVKPIMPSVKHSNSNN